MKNTNASHRDDYEADIVYGTMDDFVCNYFQCSTEVMETGNFHLSRGFITEVSMIPTIWNFQESRMTVSWCLLLKSSEAS